MKWQSCARVLVGLVCVASLGCSVGTPYRRPDIGLPHAWAAPAATGASAAPIWPAADWWHLFGSARLDELIEEAQRSNDDLAGAIARVEEADAQARIAGAPLLPSVDLSAAATRERTNLTTLAPHPFNVFNPELTASYELDFWGKNRALRASARAAAVAQPLRSADRRTDRDLQRCNDVLSGARAARSDSGGAAEPRERSANLARLHARAIRRHRHRPRCGAAGNGGRLAVRGHSAARGAIPSNGQRAGRAPRQDAGIDRREQRHVERVDEPGGDRRHTLRAAVAPPGHRGSRTAADCRQRRHHGGPRRAVSDDRSDGERRLRKHHAFLARQSRQPHLRHLRRFDPADFSRRCAARGACLQQGALYRIARRATTRRF